MRRTLATVGTVLLLASPLAGCSDDDSDGDAAEAAPSAEAPTSEAADAPALNVLPEQAPSLPTARPNALAPSGAAFDACTVMPPDLVTEIFGAIPGQAMPQQSSLGDPLSADCYYFGGEALVVAQATTRADEDLPESSYSYAGIPGAVTVPGRRPRLGDHLPRPGGRGHARLRADHRQGREGAEPLDQHHRPPL